jgi:primosomal protein N'
MYAEIAINAPVNQTFHYAVPPALQPVIKPGHLVEVPFATARQHGIVVDLLTETDVPQTKDITGLLHPQPLLTFRQIDLGLWMADRYLAPVGYCLWLMLPPGLTNGRDVRFTLLDPAADSDDPIANKLLALLRKRDGIITGHQIELAKSLHGIQWESTARRLVKDGILQQERILLPPRTRAQIVQTAALAIHPNMISSIIPTLGRESRRADLLMLLAALPDDPAPTVDGLLRACDIATRSPLEAMETDGLVNIARQHRPHTVTLATPRDQIESQLVALRKAEKHLHILQVLARENGPIDVSWLYAQTDCKLPDLQHLEELGYVLLGERPHWRDSLAEREFVLTAPPPLTVEQMAVWEPIRNAIELAHQNPYPPTPFPARGERGAGATPLNEDIHASVAPDSAEVMSSDERAWRMPPQWWEKLKPLARQMRHDPTLAEDTLWQAVRRNQLGIPIRRQHAIGRFIVDFYCPQARLIVEVDGDLHNYTVEQDAIREQILEGLGNRLIRFRNEEVLYNLPSVIQTIRTNVEDALLNPRSAHKDDHRAAPEQVPVPPLRTRGGGKGEGFLLQGVTGSGKTEIYLRAIEAVVAQGRQVIYLVPEIALTAQTIRRLGSRLVGRMAVVHSQLTEGERYDTWRRAREGLIDVVIGARSALFTPLPDVGLIILDEEHDRSYKNSETPYYHTAEVAEELLKDTNGTLLLGSATPALERVYRAATGEITHLRLPSRIIGHRQQIYQQAAKAGVEAEYNRSALPDALTMDLPPVQVVDMREELKAGNISIFSSALQTALADVLQRQQQAILFLNRRGAATYVFCRDCGYVASCPNCDSPLTYHRQGEALRCHRCGHTAPEPRTCPQCGSGRIKFFGAGTQQVEAAVNTLFPQARTLRWDADTATTAAMHEYFLQRFIERKADILIGTQMIAKGLDLPLVTLVGVVSADMALNLPDFRAGEHTFQTLTQVAGRAGRGLLGGRVILQTYQPDHYAVQFAARHDVDGFYAHEMASRQQLGYPPYRRLARVVIKAEQESRAGAEAAAAADLLRARLRTLDLGATEIIGPAPCFFRRVNTVYRWHLLLRGPDPTAVLRGFDPPRGWSVEVDPLDVL